MECSQIVGSREECSGASGSESGWTSYILSPTQENSHDDDDDGDEKDGFYRRRNYSNDEDDGDSDDSMASDASSGPSHHELQCRSNEGSVGTDHSKHGDTKCSSKTKLNKQVKQRDGVRMKGEKEDLLVIKAKSASSSSHVQTSKWNQGKRKQLNGPRDKK